MGTGSDNTGHQGPGSPNTGHQGSPGTGHQGTPGSANSGISSQDFWIPLQKGLAARGWEILSPGTQFALIARKSDWVAGMIDGQANTPSQSFDSLDRWAEKNKIAPNRLLVAAFSRATKKDIETVLKLQRGTRMLPQAMGSVINLQEGKFYRPDVPGIVWNGSQYPIFDDQIGNDLEAALHAVLMPR